MLRVRVGYSDVSRLNCRSIPIKEGSHPEFPNRDFGAFRHKQVHFAVGHFCWSAVDQTDSVVHTQDAGTFLLTYPWVIDWMQCLDKVCDWMNEACSNVLRVEKCSVCCTWLWSVNHTEGNEAAVGVLPRKVAKLVKSQYTVHYLCMQHPHPVCGGEGVCRWWGWVRK